MKVLVTGANGMIGSAIMDAIDGAGLQPIAGVRKERGGQRFPVLYMGDISLSTSCSELNFSDVNVIVHTAGMAHEPAKGGLDPMELFRRTNTLATLALARRAADAGVKRFIFISSIGVNGASTYGEPYNEAMQPMPVNQYARSKWEAEQGLMRISSESDLEVVIIRPPMVIAGSAPGNFQRLMNLVYRGIPLPLASVNNRRSLVAVENLVDFVMTCLKHPNAANQTFVVSDNEDVSTSCVVDCVAKGMGKKAVLIPFPIGFISFGAMVFNKRPMFAQLCGSLQIDCSKAISLLDWRPLVSTEKSLRIAGAIYKGIRSR